MSFVYAGQYTEAVLGRGGSGTGTFLQPTLAVNVYQVGTTTPVTLYTDRTKGATTANPVSTDVGGNLTFYADPGHYDLVFTPSGGSSQRVSVVVPVDPGELSAAYVAASVVIPTGVSATDAAALQAAHDGLPAGGGWIHVAAGTLALGTTGVTFSKRVKLTGVASMDDALGAGTLITFSGATGNAITVTAHGCVFRDLAVKNIAGSTPTAGAGLLFSAGRFAKLDNVAVIRFFNNIDFAEGWYWTMSQCDIVNPVNYGLYVHGASPSGDWGDPTIQGCTFTILSMVNAVAALRYESAGGLRFINNKVNAGDPGVGAATWGRGIDLAVADGVTTGDLLINGNSISNVTDTCVSIACKGPSNTGVFDFIEIVGNIFGQTSGTGKGISITGPAASNTQIAAVHISDNVFTGVQGSSIYAKYLSVLTIGPNTHTACGSSGTVPLIKIGDTQGGDLLWGLNLAPQKTDTADVIILLDNRTRSGDAVGLDGKIELDYDFGFDTTSTTPTTVCSLDIGTGTLGAVRVTVDCYGLDSFNGGGGGMLNNTRSRAVSGGGSVNPLTVATIGTDAEYGDTPGGLNARFVVGFDTATNNRLKITVKTAGTGTHSNGRMRVSVVGETVYRFARGAA